MGFLHRLGHEYDGGKSEVGKFDIDEFEIVRGISTIRWFSCIMSGTLWGLFESRRCEFDDIYWLKSNVEAW